MTGLAKEILQGLEGTWRLSRDISGSHIAHATGIAVFEKTTNPYELTYSEDVVITLGDGKTLKGYQRYIYRLEDENKLNVYFDGGYRIFHSVECIDSESRDEFKASHYCQPDTYITSYLFGDSVFYIMHRVSGPKKDYISRTTYNKDR